MHATMLLIATLLMSILCEAGLAQNITAQDVAGLPEYCRYTQSFRGDIKSDDPGLQHWSQQLGPVLMHMHHYCRGLIFINKGRSAAPKAKGKWYHSAVGEINYVLNYVQDDYVLLPEMLTRKGEALVQLKRFGEADASLKKAIQLKQDYWPAYARLAEGLVARDNLDGAREVLKQGLANADDPRALQRMLDDLNRRH